jgi:hypothetical protein
MLGSIVLAMILCLALALPALAADPSEITWEPGTEKNPAEAAFTKILQMGEGTTTPETIFEFLFTPKTVNGVPYANGNMPLIGDNMVLNLEFDKNDPSITANGKKIVIKESDNFLKDLEWPHAGVYIYTVTENNDTFSNTAQETMKFSGAKYDLYVYVENGEEGLYVSLVGALIIVIDTEDGGKVGEKVDPTPGGDPEIDGDYSKMIFTNDYLKKTTENPDTNDKGAFFISKTVSNQFADGSKYFKFSVTVTSPAIPSASKTYKAYVINDKNQVVTSADNFKGTFAADGAIIFTAGAELDVYLKHGQKLVFVDMYIGGYFTVTEAANADYTPACKLTVNGIATDIPGSLGGALIAPETGVATLGEAANSAAFNNAYKQVTPTGISVDNLPYLIMIALALLALTGFVVVKTRLGLKYNA